MRIRLSNMLVAINILTLVLVLAIYLGASNILRIILGIPFLLFVPGYTLVAALFPDRERMSGTERVALSLGLSVAVVPLIGLILNYTPWGIRLEPVVYSVALFVFVTSAITWLRLTVRPRQENLLQQERSAAEFRMETPGRGKGIWDRALTIAMVIVMIGAVATVANFIAKPKGTEQFTQFYILGQDGKVVDYPRNLKVGEKGPTVVVGIENHEGTDVTYRVQVLVDGNENTELGPITLADEQESRTEVGLVLESAGENQKIEFLLYKNNETKPYLEPLYLWVNVSG